MVKISVIIPVYNTECYLRKCLDSVRMQTFKDIEIICIDDGSNDSSLKILNDYKKKDSRFVILQQNHLGAGNARNKGIEISNGDYLQFLDSDDYFEPNMIQELYNYSTKYDADITVCSARKVDDNGNIVETGNPNSPINLDITPLEKVFCKNDFKENIFSILTPVPWNKLYKKSLIKNNNITFPDVKISEDIAFVNACLACANRIIVFNKELINYRYNSCGSMATYRSKYAIDTVKSCLHFKEFLYNKKLYKELETAFFKSFTNHVRWELTFCNEKDCENFFKEFKNLMPNEWQKYLPHIQKNYINYEYLNNIIGDKKTILWGASVFIQNILNKQNSLNPNIIGFIDGNKSLQGKKCAGYNVFSSDILNKNKPECILMTVLSNNEIIYKSIKEFLNTNYPEIELLPNIFENIN